jgi:hypothetical protein
MQNHRVLEMRDRLTDWFNKFNFDSFLTLTMPFRARRIADIALLIDKPLNRLMEQYGLAYGVEFNGLGVATVDYTNRVHAHMMGSREDGQPITPEELDWFKRTWGSNADARPIHDQETLSRYFLINKHIGNCKGYETIFCGNVPYAI